MERTAFIKTKTSNIRTGTVSGAWGVPKATTIWIATKDADDTFEFAFDLTEARLRANLKKWGYRILN